MSYASAAFATVPYASVEVLGAVEISTLVVDSLDWTELLTAQELVNLLSRLGVGDDVLSSADRQVVVVEALRVAGLLRIALDAIALDSITLDALFTGTPLVTLAVVDALVASGVVTSSVNALALLADTLAVRDVLSSLALADVADVATLAEILETTASLYADALSAAAFSETAAAMAVVSVLVPDVFELGSDPAAIALRLAGIEDGLEVAISFTFEDEPYFALSMNAASRATAEYTGFGFNSVATYNGETYAAGAAGLYRLGGNTDAGQPIAAMVRTAMQRVAQGNASRVSDAYLGFRGDGSLQLKVVVKDRADNQQKGYVFDMVQSPAGAPLPGRFKLGKGLQSVYMAFELSNVAGADFAIDVLEIRPLVSYRKLP